MVDNLATRRIINIGKIINAEELASVERYAGEVMNIYRGWASSENSYTSPILCSTGTPRVRVSAYQFILACDWWITTATRDTLIKTASGDGFTYEANEAKIVITNAPLYELYVKNRGESPTMLPELERL